jgi:hypothetical protein
VFTPLLLAVGGCATAPGPVAILGGVIRESFLTFLRVGFVTVVIFAFLGLGLAIGGFFLIRRLGGYRWDWAAAKWFRLATLILMVLALPFLATVFGFYEGLYRGAERALTTGRISTEVYPKVGGAGAEIVAGVYLIARQHPNVDRPLSAIEIPMADIERFRSGSWELDVNDLEAQLGRLDAALLERMVAPLKAYAQEQYPSLRSGIGERFLDLAVDGVLRGSAQVAIRSKARLSGLRGPARGFLDDMRRQAALSGARQTMTHAQLSSCVVEALLVRPLLHAARLLARAHQLLVTLLAAVVMGMPVAFFRTAHAIHARTGGRKAD